MSAVMSDQATNNVAELFTPGPGERLRAARLAMGLDLGRIASELHLTGKVVESLEADDYADIGARVFVRGYLRNYARIVGMPVESILRQFDDRWPDEGRLTSMIRQSPRLPADVGPGHGILGLTTWVLIAGLGGLFFIWWSGHLDSLVPEQMRSVSADSTDQGSAPVDLSAVPRYGDGRLALPAAVADEAPDVAQRAAPAAPVDMPELTLDSSAPDDALEALPDGQASMRPAPEALAPLDLPLPGGVGEIVMTFNAACWVDVRDSERKFKLFGEMPKGMRKVLEGQPPYNMVIGNANAVSITVDGEPFDLAPYAKGNVARFTLEP